VFHEKIFDNLWIQPAAGDAGGALGAALAAYHIYQCQPRVPHNGADGMQCAYLGPAFSQAEIESRLRSGRRAFLRAER
jgi:carbamoyltransferase